MRLLRLTLLLAVPLMLGGCLSTPRLGPVEAAAPAFRVADFFVGRTQGAGVLRVLASGARTVRVQSIGRREADGTVVLDQIIDEEGRERRSRSWRLQEVAPGRYAGSLSDAAGPVTGIASGNRLHLTFRSSGGLDIAQWLTLAPGGRSARNVLRARKFGLTVAVLEERIQRLD